MIEISVGNLYCTLNRKLATINEIDAIHKALSVKVPGHYFVKTFRRGLWDGYKRFFNRLTCTFYTGLLGFLLRQIEENDFQVSLIDKRVYVPHFNHPLLLNEIELRDYQIKMVNEAVEHQRGIIAAPPNAGKCLCGNVLISLSNGTLKAVKYLKPGDNIFSLNEKLEHVNDVVERVYDNGIKPLFKIITTTGKEIIGTGNHPILVGLEFKCIKDLQIGDLIGTVRKYSIKEFTNLEDSKIIFLAYYLSEGSYTKGGSVIFDNTNSFILNEYRSSVELIFKDTEVVEDKPRFNCRVFRLRKKKKDHRRCSAQRFLDSFELEGKNSHFKVIPEIIFKLSDKKLALFLNRYFCGDGYYGIKDGYPYVGVTSASFKMLHQLSHLLLRFGVFGIIRERLIRNKFVAWEWSSNHNESVSNFVKYVGIKYKAKIERKIIKNLLNHENVSKYDIIPVRWSNISRDDIPYKMHKGKRKYLNKNWVKKNSFITRAQAKKVDTVKIFTSDYVKWDKIKTIEIFPSEETFNITTKENHNFIANEIYTHNTEVACGIIQVLGLPTNFFTHRLALLSQTKERIEKRLGIEVGVIGGGKFDIKEVNIISPASICRKLEDPAVKQLLDSTPVVISDECHRISSKTWESCLKACSGAYYRYGLSATALMRDDISNMLVMGLTGDEIAGVTNKELIDRGISAFPSVYLIGIHTPKIPSHYTFDQAYDDGILYNVDRNTKIVETARRFINENKSVFILVWRIAHGDVLMQMFQDMGIEAEFIKGGSAEQIADPIKRFSKKKLRCLISSTISDEGLDVPAMDVLIMGVGFKAPARVVQRVGRSLRQKAAGTENVVKIIDFVDFHSSKYLLKHSRSRMVEYVKLGIDMYEITDFDKWESISV